MGTYYISRNANVTFYEGHIRPLGVGRAGGTTSILSFVNDLYLLAGTVDNETSTILIHSIQHQQQPPRGARTRGQRVNSEKARDQF